MKKLITILLLFSVLMTACAASSTASTDPTNSSVNASPSADSQQKLDPAALAGSRQAVLSEFHNDVQVRLSEGAELSSAHTDLVLPVGGSIQTGDNSRATLNLLPDGTIIRVAPNSTFTVKSIEMVDGKPQTTITLLFGKVWILLSGGKLDVETQSGVASVRGSLLSVEYDPETKNTDASCLEGSCGLQDDSGQNEVELTDGESSSVGEDGETSGVEQMTEEELQDWVNENPESVDYFNGDIPDWLPEPDPEFNPDDNSPEATEAPGDQPSSEATEAPADQPPPDDSGNPPDDSGGGDDGSGGTDP